ncbi:MAG UNVERIFIED_CONTAM: hypothetical protein LVR29_32425 [Microcystis novacekii LVE1205-3]
MASIRAWMSVMDLEIWYNTPTPQNPNTPTPQHPNTLRPQHPKTYSAFLL